VRKCEKCEKCEMWCEEGIKILIASHLMRQKKIAFLHFFASDSHRTTIPGCAIAFFMGLEHTYIRQCYILKKLLVGSVWEALHIHLHDWASILTPSVLCLVSFIWGNFYSKENYEIMCTV
jgi:hypothetical protein